MMNYIGRSTVSETNSAFCILHYAFYTVIPNRSMAIFLPR